MRMGRDRPRRRPRKGARPPGKRELRSGGKTRSRECGEKKDRIVEPGPVREEEGKDDVPRCKNPKIVPGGEKRSLAAVRDGDNNTIQGNPCRSDNHGTADMLHVNGGKGETPGTTGHTPCTRRYAGEKTHTPFREGSRCLVACLR